MLINLLKKTKDFLFILQMCKCIANTIYAIKAFRDFIKFQHSYTAAAKLITTADQMLETILGLKQ